MLQERNKKISFHFSSYLFYLLKMRDNDDDDFSEIKCICLF